MDNVEISIMSVSDLELIKDSLLTDFDDFWSYNTFKNELINPNSKYIIAKTNNEIVGFAGLWKSVDDVHIKKMAKSEKNITSITLEVNSNNLAAQKLYEKFGFKVVGLRKKYYNNIDDAIIYTKDLN